MSKVCYECSATLLQDITQTYEATYVLSMLVRSRTGRLAISNAGTELCESEYGKVKSGLQDGPPKGARLRDLFFALDFSQAFSGPAISADAKPSGFKFLDWYTVHDGLPKSFVYFTGGGDRGWYDFQTRTQKKKNVPAPWARKVAEHELKDLQAILSEPRGDNDQGAFEAAAEYFGNV